MKHCGTTAKLETSTLNLYNGFIMNTENIVNLIRDIVWYAKSYASNAYDDKRDADRVFLNVVEGAEYTKHGYETVSDGLIEASEALDRAYDRFMEIESMLLKLAETVEMETLSYKVQSK